MALLAMRTLDVEGASLQASRNTVQSCGYDAPRPAAAVVAANRHRSMSLISLTVITLMLASLSIVDAANVRHRAMVLSTESASSTISPSHQTPLPSLLQLQATSTSQVGSASTAVSSLAEQAQAALAARIRSQSALKSRARYQNGEWGLFGFGAVKFTGMSMSCSSSVAAYGTPPPYSGAALLML